LGSHIISAFARYYDLKSVVGVINKIRKDHVFNDNLSIRFDQECETTEDFSVWKHPIFKEILRDDQKMRAFEVARKKNCDAIDYAVALGIDLEKTKPQFTDDLLRKND